MYRKFKGAVLAVGLTALLAACVSTGQKPGELPPMSRLEATTLKAPIYSVDIAAANGPAAKKALSDAFMRIYNNTPTDTRYGNPRVIEETERGFRIRSNRAGASIGVRQPPDIEIVFFLEEIPGQPAQVRANTYFVAIQEPGEDERRFSYANVGAMSEDNNKRMMDQILPQLQQQLGGQRTAFILPTPLAVPVRIMPARSNEMIRLEQLFLASDANGARQHARAMADAGNSVAQCALAYFDFAGIGGAKNAESGQQWLDKALAANDAVCKAAADLYGWNRKQDMPAALDGLRASAETGNIHALYLLGWIAQDAGRRNNNNKSLLLNAAQLWAAAARLGLDSIQPQLDAALAALDDEDRSRVSRYASQWAKL